MFNGIDKIHLICAGSRGPGILGRSGKVKFKSFSASDLVACMLPTVCPPTIWAISLEVWGTRHLEADNFLGACCRKAMTQKAMDFTFSLRGGGL